MPYVRAAHVSSIAVLLSSCGLAHAQVLPAPVLSRDVTGAMPPRIVEGAPAWGDPGELPPGMPSSNLMADAPIAVCFAEGTDPRYVSLVHQWAENRNRALMGTDYNLGGTWGAPGRPVTLRWSFIPDGTLAPGLNPGEDAPSNLFATLNSQFASQGGQATWINRFTQSFARWAQVTGNVYIRVRFNNTEVDDGAAFGTAGADGLRGDVRIGMRSLGAAGGVLAFNYFPGFGIGGDMVLDSLENWGQTTNQNIFLRNVIMHEHGHGLGLAHVCTSNSNQLMEPFLNTSFDGPRQDDIRGAQALYGDPFAPNNQISAPRFLANVAVGFNQTWGTIPAPLTGTNDANASLISLGNFASSDFYRITVSGPMLLSVTATPIGSTYQNAEQPASGTCPSGTAPAFDALRQGDLLIRVWNAPGSFALATRDATGLGSAETLTGALLNAAGDYIVEVGAQTNLSQTQGYRLQITSAAAANAAPTIVVQPAGTTVCEGTSVVLSGFANGLPVPTLQWRRNNVNIPGATGPTLDLGVVDPSDAGSYTLVATNSAGNATSNPAVLNVNGTPVVIQEPQSAIVPLGGSATFTATLGGTVSEVQWTFNSVPIPGATNASLTISPVSAADEGFYQLSYVGPCGTGQTLAASLTIGQTVSCYANCDGSTTAPVLNALDFSCFLSKYVAGEAYANCDGSTTAPALNALDFSCFLGRYVAGCR